MKPLRAWMAVLLLALAGQAHGAAAHGSGRGAGYGAGHAAGHAAGGIAWFRGTPDAAFAAARAAHKPILLYWGAIWCPPCLQLKATVFSRPDFIAKSRLFVPVYLDGDDAGAQKWGERFKVSGYPTLVVLDAGGREMMRLAGSMDLASYASALDVALADLQPADDLLARTAAGAALDANGCRRLALNGWLLDDLPPAAQLAMRARQLLQAADACPASLPTERARLAVVGASLLAQSQSAALKAGTPPTPDLLAAIGQVDAVLANAPAAARLADALRAVGGDLLRAAKATPGAAQWLARYEHVMELAAADTTYAEADRLAAIVARLRALNGIAGAVPAEVASDAVARVDAALARKSTPWVRTSLVNSALNIHEALGRHDLAYALAKAEVATSATPYYHMDDLGEICEAWGRGDEALQWFARGYAEAKGDATRFQWGVNYAAALTRLAPSDEARIGAVAAQVLDELDGPDRIYRRARTRLEQLDKALRDWNAASGARHGQVLASLRARMQSQCVKLPATDGARGSCDAFLAPAQG